MKEVSVVSAASQSKMAPTVSTLVIRHSEFYHAMEEAWLGLAKVILVFGGKQ